MKLVVKENALLLEYLCDNLDMSRKKIKSFLGYRLISVDGKIITKYDYPIKKDMEIIINTEIKKNDYPFEIIYEDKYIIVVDKPSNLLTISTSTETEKTLYHYVSNYVKSKDKHNKIFVVHRLDKDTSGIVVLAKDQKIKELLQNKWNSLASVREYRAVVNGEVKKDKDRLVNYLSKNKQNLVYISNEKEGKLSITNYLVIKRNTRFSELQILIETGRQNQIRVQLANIGHYIIGDSKYGKKEKGIKRLYLHASKLVLFHPILNKDLTFKADIPDEFINIMK